VKQVLDHYDTSIPINSGFGIQRDDFKRKLLDMMNPTNTTKVRQALRVLKTNEPLTDQEKKLAIEQNLAGRRKTMEVMGITYKDLVRWQLKPTENAPPEQNPKLETFRRFEHAYDKGKLMKFIIKLQALVKAKNTRQLLLLTKISDRAHNIDTQEEMPLHYQRSNLRATVSRLLAYCILDHDNQEMPLYDALPYLIEVTVKAYKQLAKSNPEQMEPLDQELLAQAEHWQLEVVRLQLPQKIEEILAQFKKTKKENSPNTEPEDSFDPRI